jgi:uncharacterized membrane protein
MNNHPDNRKATIHRIVLVLIATALFLGWLNFTPAGLLGKADAVGYAVCHRISARSYHIGDRETPMCARCSGMYLGALAALLYQARLGKKYKLPPLKILVILAIFLIAFGIDGINSYLHLFPNAPSLYQPNNILRLLTGTGLGIGMGIMLLPVFNQTIWTDSENVPLVSSWRQFIEILAIVLVIDVAVYSEIPLLLYPLALMSSATVLALLSMIYTLVWVMLGKRENNYTSLKELYPTLLGGFITALAQIALMDYARFLITGTWNGFFS